MMLSLSLTYRLSPFTSLLPKLLFKYTSCAARLWEKPSLFVLCHSNRISVLSWRWYDVWDETKKAPSLHFSPTQGIFNLWYHVGMVWEELTFEAALNYTQQWKSKLAEVMAWGNWTRGLQIRNANSNKVRHANHSTTEDASAPVGVCVYGEFVSLYRCLMHT